MEIKKIHVGKTYEHRKNCTELSTELTIHMELPSIESSGFSWCANHAV